MCDGHVNNRLFVFLLFILPMLLFAFVVTAHLLCVNFLEIGQAVPLRLPLYLTPVSTLPVTWATDPLAATPESRHSQECWGAHSLLPCWPLGVDSEMVCKHTQTQRLRNLTVSGAEMSQGPPGHRTAG